MVHHFEIDSTCKNLVTDLGIKKLNHLISLITPPEVPQIVDIHLAVVL